MPRAGHHDLLHLKSSKLWTGLALSSIVVNPAFSRIRVVLAIHLKGGGVMVVPRVVILELLQRFQLLLQMTDHRLIALGLCLGDLAFVLGDVLINGLHGIRTFQNQRQH